MAKVQKPPAALLASTQGTTRVGGGIVPEEFPTGMKVLVVDDDPTCLMVLERMLSECLYDVTTCCQATTALSLLRESKGGFDVVLTDVHMPDMDGLKLLELVGLEMDLPVIMMSADGRTSVVMQGISHGACDYLLKPVRMEELRNIWQHVVRKRWHDSKEHSSSMEDSDHNRRVTDDAEHNSSVNDGSDGSSKYHKKRRDPSENDDELDNGDPSSKKGRVVWSIELHQQFVSAVNQLGIDKAVPKKILELMNVPGITRENVASHLQKYRMYLKRLSGVAQQQGLLPNSFYGAVDPNAKMGPLGRLDFPALAVSGQIPTETLAALQAELLGQPSGSLAMPAMDQPVLRQASVQGPSHIPVERGIAFGQPLMNCQTYMSKQFPRSSIAVKDVPSCFSTLSANNLVSGDSSSNLGGVNSQNGSILVQRVQQQPPNSVLSETRHANSIQPSCLVVPNQSLSSFQVGDNAILINQNSMAVPSQSLANFQAGSNPALTNQNMVICSQSPSSFQAGNAPVLRDQNSGYNNVSPILDFDLLSSPSNNLPLDMGQGLEDFRNVGVLNSYSIHGSTSSSVSSCADSSMNWLVQAPDVNVGPPSSLPGFVPNLYNIQDSEAVAGTSTVQGPGWNLGFSGKGACIPSRYAVDDTESPIKNMNQKNIMGGDGNSETRSAFGFYRQL